MKYKVGDKVKFIKPCTSGCIFCNRRLNTEATIVEESINFPLFYDIEFEDRRVWCVEEKRLSPSKIIGEQLYLL